MITYYNVLGVKWNASYEKIKEAYKALRNPVQRSTYNLKIGLVFLNSTTTGSGQRK